MLTAGAVTATFALPPTTLASTPYGHPQAVQYTRLRVRLAAGVKCAPLASPGFLTATSLRLYRGHTVLPILLNTGMLLLPRHTPLAFGTIALSIASIPLLPATTAAGCWLVGDEGPALAEHLEAHRNPTSAPKAREVGTLATWVTAFATYIAIVAVAHPGRVRDMLAYICLVVCEAQTFGGTGWLTYDQVFGRNRPGLDARWDHLDPSLHIAYIPSQADTPITPCAICSEVDHSTEDCALCKVTPPTKKALAALSGARDMGRSGPSHTKC